MPAQPLGDHLRQWGRALLSARDGVPGACRHLFSTLYLRYALRNRPPLPENDRCPRPRTNWPAGSVCRRHFYLPSPLPRPLGEYKNGQDPSKVQEGGGRQAAGLRWEARARRGARCRQCTCMSSCNTQASARRCLLHPLPLPPPLLPAASRRSLPPCLLRPPCVQMPPPSHSKTRCSSPWRS